MKREFISERCLPVLFLSGILLLLSLLIVPPSNAVECQCMGAIADAKATVEVTANQIKADLASVEKQLEDVEPGDLKEFLEEKKSKLTALLEEVNTLLGKITAMEERCREAEASGDCKTADEIAAQVGTWAQEAEDIAEEAKEEFEEPMPTITTWLTTTTTTTTTTTRCP